jgi:hypothetical protein
MEESKPEYRSFEEQQKVLHSPFDPDVHKRTFINYLEVMIDKDGVVHYAIPSHLEYLIREAMRRFNVSRNELLDMYLDHKLDFMEALLADLEFVALWTYSCMGKPNEAQRNAMDRLREMGLFKPSEEENK